MPAIEFWLRGAVSGVPPQLQPAAHAILQVAEDLKELMHGFDESLLWSRPNNIASVAFHLKHIVGVLDRLVTYANGDALNEQQREYLANEGNNMGESLETLVLRVQNQANKYVSYLRSVQPRSVTDVRTVGRAKLPSTVMGLLFHAAEHSQRHFGQLLVTVRMQQSAHASNS